MRRPSREDGIDVTIRRGEPWGSEVARPTGLVTVDSDAELARHLDAADVPVTIRGGDVHRTLGSPGRRDTMQRLPLDLLRVRVDGVEHVAVAHVIARRNWLRGPLLAIMNVDHRGAWNVAPRAHPNDGRFDVIDVAPSMGLRDRLAARRRLPTGAHLPHPAIRATTVTTFERRFVHPMRIEIDGVRAGAATELAVEIEPDAGAVHV